MKIKSAKIIACFTLINIFLSSELLLSANYLAPPQTETVFSEFDIFTSEEEAFFNDEDTVWNKRNEIHMTVSKKNTDKTISYNILYLLQDAEEFKKLLFIRVSVEGEDTSGLKERLSDFGFIYKESDAAFTIPDMLHLLMLKQKISKVDKTWGEYLIVDTLTDEMYETAKKEHTNINRQKKKYRKCLEKIRDGDYKKAQKALVVFMKNNYSFFL